MKVFQITGAKVARNLNLPKKEYERTSAMLINVCCSFDNEAVKQIKLFLFFNGDITSYCDSTGVYQSKYFSKKKEFVANLCFDDKKNGQDTNWKMQTFFLSELVKLLLQCGVLLRLKLEKNKLFI